MESSSPSGKVSEPPARRWTNLMGIAIAMITLTLPIVVIAYYSSSQATPGNSTHLYLDNPRE